MFGRKHLQRFWVRHSFGSNPKIAAGPFAGMNYSFQSHGSSIVPKLVGSYEAPIAGWIEQAILRHYPRVIDIGAAEGYYAVGFAYKKATDRVFAFDIAPQAQQMLAATAALNHLEVPVEIAGLCTPNRLEELAGEGSFLICDIEGAEWALLDPQKVPALLKTDMLVECHDFARPGIGDALIERFHLSHQIEIMADTRRDYSQCVWPKLFTKRMKRKWLNEGRPAGMFWLRLSVRRS